MTKAWLTRVTQTQETFTRETQTQGTCDTQAQLKSFFNGASLACVCVAPVHTCETERKRKHKEFLAFTFVLG